MRGKLSRWRSCLRYAVASSAHCSVDASPLRYNVDAALDITLEPQHKMAETGAPSGAAAIPPPPSDGWKHEGVRVVPGNQLDTNTAQTPGMNRAAAINLARTGAQKLWAGTVHIHPNAKTGAHHHGHLESVIYIVKGKARMRYARSSDRWWIEINH